MFLKKKNTIVRIVEELTSDLYETFFSLCGTESGTSVTSGTSGNSRAAKEFNVASGWEACGDWCWFRSGQQSSKIL